MPEAKILELTAEDKAKPYSKYFYRPVDAPDPVLLELVRPGKPMDMAKALYPEDINRLLDPGYMEVETGWCRLPNGAGYICVNNKMPGVTVDMLDWWFAWHSLASMHYGIWYPPGHFAISTSKKDRARVKDPNVPIKEAHKMTAAQAIKELGAAGFTMVERSEILPWQHILIFGRVDRR